jgi:long-chain acyl-CoA synthetase
LNPAAPPAELGRELEMVEASIVLAAGPAVGMLGAAGATVTVIVLDDLPDAGAGRVERGDDDVAVLLFTSGTAGAPKAAMLTHGNLAANIRQVLDHPGLRLDSSDIALGVLPFFHVFGLNAVLGLALAAGASVALESHFGARESAELVREHRVTVVAGVPAMYEAWLGLGETVAPSDTFASVRLAVSGAAPLPGEVAIAFEERFGVVLHQGYGLTEASPIVTTTALSGHRPKPGSIGPPLPGVDVRLVDAEDGDALVGDPGEIWAHGPNVFAGYWKDSEATARVLTPDHWLRTGDIAVIEDDGDLRLVDRAKDLIIVSGFNVYPVEVEDVLHDHPDVADVAVVGEPSPRTGEAVVAYVVPVVDATPDPNALLQHCAHALARYKCPTRIEIVDAIPRSPSGKVLRRELR